MVSDSIPKATVVVDMQLFASGQRRRRFHLLRMMMRTKLFWGARPRAYAHDAKSPSCVLGPAARS